MKTALIAFVCALAGAVIGFATAAVLAAARCGDCGVTVLDELGEEIRKKGERPDEMKSGTDGSHAPEPKNE